MDKANEEREMSLSLQIKEETLEVPGENNDLESNCEYEVTAEHDSMGVEIKQEVPEVDIEPFTVKQEDHFEEDADDPL